MPAVLVASLAASAVLSVVGLARRSWWAFAVAATITLLGAAVAGFSYGLLVAPIGSLQLVAAVALRWNVGFVGWLVLLAAGVTAWAAPFLPLPFDGGYALAVLIPAFIVAAAMALVLGDPTFRGTPRR